MQDQINAFHKNAKDAGNRLSTIVTNSSIGAVAVFFLAITQKVTVYSFAEKLSLIIALVAFVVASFFRLLELHLDARRFYQVAIQLQREEEGHIADWTKADHYKNFRLFTIWLSYLFFGLGVLAACGFMIARIT